ncbi:MAG: alpha/beta hydrolase, partial [Acidimicrobiia bacterium]
MAGSPEVERVFTTWRELFPAGEGLTIEDFRNCWDATFAQMPLPDDVAVTESRANGVRSLRVEIRDAPVDRHLLLLHGGGYMCGNPEGVRDLAARLARAARADVLVPDYRLAPENPHPAAVEDAVRAYRSLVGDRAPERCAVVGESAGGGLALATMVAVRDQGGPLPAAGCCFSAWLDMTVSGASVTSKAEVDPIASGDSLRMSAQAYLQGQEPTLPLASPLHADLTGLPPLLLQVGSEEVLLDDSTRLAEKARQAGVDVTLEVADGLPHVFQYFASFLP